jgi:hypothetical protein
LSNVLFGCIVDATESQGIDTSSIRHVEYSNYDKLVLKYHVVLRGYPIDDAGHIVSPSNFPGGIKGLMHADTQLMSGAWGFEKISEDIYEEWKAKYDGAEQEDSTKPATPYVPVPGTEFKLVQARKPAATSSGSSHKRKKAPTHRKANAKEISRAIIDDSDEDVEPEPEHAEDSDSSVSSGTPGDDE